MAKVNSSRQAPKGVRLGWTSLKEVNSVSLSSDAIHGIRSSSNGKFVKRDSRSGHFSERTTTGRDRNNNSNDSFLIP